MKCLIGFYILNTRHQQNIGRLKIALLVTGRSSYFGLVPYFTICFDCLVP